jgi:hypothetical protein
MVFHSLMASQELYQRSHQGRAWYIECFLEVGVYHTVSGWMFLGLECQIYFLQTRHMLSQ